MLRLSRRWASYSRGAGIGNKQGFSTSGVRLRISWCLCMGCLLLPSIDHHQSLLSDALNRRAQYTLS